MQTTPRPRADQAQLLVVDIQERLLPHVDNVENMIAQSIRMIRAARVLELPVTVSEQYPKGLGPTEPGVLEAAGDAPRFEKVTFSYCGDDACRAHIQSLGRAQVLLIGIEAHVCVQQTALDLLEMGMQPFVLADAVSSQRGPERDVAFDRMRAAGVVVTTVESAIYEMMQRSGTDLFKRMLPVVR